MRVNGVRVRIKRVLGAFSVLLALFFAGGYLTARLTLEPTTPLQAQLSDPLDLPKENTEAKAQVAILDRDPILSKPDQDIPTISELGPIQRIEAAHKAFTDQIENASNPYKYLLLRGELYLSLTLYDRAQTDFDRALDIQDDSFAAYLGRGKAFSGLGEVEEAEADLTEAIDLDASKSIGYSARAQLLWELGKFSEAKQDLEVAKVRDPRDEGLVKDLAMLCEEMNDFSSAKKHYLELKESAQNEHRAFAWFALKRLGTLMDKPFKEPASFQNLIAGKPELLLEQARLFIHSKKFNQAGQSLEAALEVLRSEAKIRAHFQAWRQSEKAIFTKSERLYRDALTLSIIVQSQITLKSSALLRDLTELQDAFPDSMEAALAHSYVSKTQLSRESYEKRLKHGETRFERTFRSARLRKLAPHIFERDGPARNRQKCRVYQRLLYLNPWHYQARFERAKICVKEKHDLNRVDSDLQSVLAVAPKHWEARYLRAQCLLSSGGQANLKEARLEFSRVIEQLENTPLRVDQNAMDIHIAESYYGRSLVTAAEKKAGFPLTSPRSITDDLKVAIHRVPRDNPRGLNNAIKYYSARGRHDRIMWLGYGANKDFLSAKLCRNEAIERSLVHYKLGLKARDNREYNKAIAQFNKALDYDPSNDKIIYDRGLSFLKIGNFMPGVLDFAKAVELNHRYGIQLYNKVYQCNYAIDMKRVVDEVVRYTKMYPNDAHVSFIAGFFYLAATDYRQYDVSALKDGEIYFNRAIELNPKFVCAYISRGRIRLRLNRYNDALNDVNKALKLAPDAWNAHFYKSKLLASRVPQSSPDSKKKALIKEATKLLATTLKNVPGLVDRAVFTIEFKHLFSNESERKAFLEKFRSKD